MATDTLPTADSGGGDTGTITADVVVTDRELFDSATAPDPAPQKEAPTAPPPRPQAPPAQNRPRDDQGRFAEKPPAPKAKPGARPPQQEPPPHVPLRTYLDEREARYRAQAEADQARQHWERMQWEAQQQQLAQQRQAQPQTIYDNPEQYLIHNVINPMRQEMMMRELQRTDMMSREFANAQFGAQRVDQALQALAQIRQSPQGDFLFRQIMGSGHPYGALVQWHHNLRQSEQVRQQLVDDPDGKKQREKLLSDPAFRAEAIKREQQQRQQQRGGQPNVQLPPSLSTMPAASGRAGDIGDMSDSSLFRFAIS